MRKVIRIPIKQGKDEGNYIEVEDEDGEMRNVWITDIIRNELSNFTLQNGNVNIIPLGDKKSTESGNTYFNFLVQEY